MSKPKCPACNNTGDCFRQRTKNRRFWFPCPVCNGARWDKPNMERYEKLLSDPTFIKPDDVPKKGKDNEQK